MTGARFWSFHLIEEALQHAPESTRLALLTSVESILANPLEPEGLRVIRARGENDGLIWPQFGGVATV